jgi:nicotinamide-nucleotide amidase
MVRPWVIKNKRQSGCSIIHGILASQSIISVKFTVLGTNPNKVEDVIARLTKDVREILGDLIFGEGQDTLESIVGHLLKEKNKTVGVAESCTGGLLSKFLTDQAGASDYFIEGIVTYSNRSKINRLGVQPTTLQSEGAVSEQTAKEMVEGLRKSAGVDYALSITGIAGPSGGTPKKPVGLVYIGVAGPKQTLVKEFKFSGERALIRQRAAMTALDMLRKELL